MPEISVVVSVYNEEDNIQPLVDWIHQSLQGYTYEIVYADDGSTDSTRERIKALNDPKVKLVQLQKNYGQSSALAAGIEVAEGEFIVTMDGDLQNDPSDIPMMLQRAKEHDFDLVTGIRANRQDKLFVRKVPSLIANAIIRRSTDVHIKDLGCALKVFRARTAKNLGLYGELHRFIAILAHFDGAKIDQVDVKHHARQHGTSKYGLNRTFKVLSDLILMVFFRKYLQRPMHLFGPWGLGLFGIGMMLNTYFLVLKVLGNDIWGRPLLLVGVLLTMGGIQLITTGLVLEFLMRTYYESQQKRPYRIKKIFVGGEAHPEAVPAGH